MKVLRDGRVRAMADQMSILIKFQVKKNVKGLRASVHVALTQIINIRTTVYCKLVFLGAHLVIHHYVSTSSHYSVCSTIESSLQQTG